jgi:hypothetical protein
MRILNLVLACVFVLAGVTAGDSFEGVLPGAGTFSYIGAPIANDAASPTVATW